MCFLYLDLDSSTTFQDVLHVCPSIVCSLASCKAPSCIDYLIYAQGYR